MSGPHRRDAPDPLPFHFDHNVSPSNMVSQNALLRHWKHASDVVHELFTTRGGRVDPFTRLW